MAISLLPKKTRKKQFKINRELIRENKPVVFAGIVLLGAVSLHAALSIYTGSLEGKIEAFVSEAKSIQEQRDVSMEEQVITLNRKFSAVEELLNSQTLSSKLFAFIETITHPSVYFINFTFRANDKTVILNGSTENYRTFGEQYIAFQQNKSISDIRVSSVKLSKNGKVEFGISFAVEESIYKP